MVKTDVEREIGLVEAGLAVATGEMEPLVRESLMPIDYRLARVLLTTLALGLRSIDKKAISACQSLEILDQALRLGETISTNIDMRDNDLLICDYLYAQAINQVTGIKEPAVINFLAKAITRTAEDRASQTQRHARHYLFAAALDIALHLGDFPRERESAIKNAKIRSLEAFPESSAEAYLVEAIDLGATE